MKLNFIYLISATISKGPAVEPIRVTPSTSKSRAVPGSPHLERGCKEILHDVCEELQVLIAPEEGREGQDSVILPHPQKAKAKYNAVFNVRPLKVIRRLESIQVNRTPYTIFCLPS